MNANAVPLLAIFEKKIRFEVPLFQRQYVWGREQQWEPLWEDISRKFGEYLDGRKDAPVHFLGAMVLDQKQTPVTHVEKRQVIDGQQRLTTLQIFLAAFRDFCQANDCGDLADECNGFILNKGMMADPAVDKFKLWPTQLDRDQFRDVVEAGSRQEIEARHPLRWRKWARKPEPRPRMVRAYLFFEEQLRDFFSPGEGQPIKGDVALGQRLEECFQALKNSLQVVAIDLDKGDDAQVIFETLNARGEPLLPADLLRNYIFLRAARSGEPQESLYEAHWQKFDDPFWREEVKQGRLNRPRSDLFMQHFLASHQGRDIPIKHLYVEYKYWIERNQPFATVTDELVALSKSGDNFRRIIDPEADDPIRGLVRFLDAFDIRTTYPFLLALLDASLNEMQWREVSMCLESYLLRRAVCSLTTKNYNRVFLSLTRNVRREGITAENITKYLASQTGESSEWPTDDAFRAAWRTQNAYDNLSNSKLVHIFKRLNETFHTKKMEGVVVEGPLTIEHVLPQDWIEHWPLADGSKGLTQSELWSADDNDPVAIATRAREDACQTIGNLTIVTQSLNSAASNGPWAEKKLQLLNSLLPINHALKDEVTWDEAAISRRAELLLNRALTLWPHP